jgi:BirA family biotin operon repressor/biotin-[acetyl-CoA-carboxylase] ligase
MEIGGKIIRLKNVDSTNRMILSDEYRHMPIGTVLTAEIQTAGRGRGSNLWFSPHGGLYFSILLSAQEPLGNYNKLAIMIAYTIRNKLMKFAQNADFRIKWPNDVFADDRKICGILIQAKTRGEESRIAIGIGINLNIAEGGFPEELGRNAVSLSELTGAEIDSERFLAELLPEIDDTNRAFLAGGFESILDEINIALYSKGRERDFIVRGKTVNYRILGINPDATLRVYSPETGIISLDMGELK